MAPFSGVGGSVRFESVVGLGFEKYGDCMPVAVG